MKDFFLCGPCGSAVNTVRYSMTKRLLPFVVFLLFSFPASVLGADDCRIVSIELKTLPNKDLILVKADSPVPSWHDFTLPDPSRLAVDLYDSEYQGRLIPDARKGRYIQQLRFGRYHGKTRIAANLPEDIPIEHRVVKSGNELAVYIGPPPLSTESENVALTKADTSQSDFPVLEETKPDMPIEEMTFESDSAEIVTAQDPFEETDGEEEAFSFPDSEEPFDIEPGHDAKGEFDTPWAEGESEKKSSFSLGGRLWNKYAHNVDEDNAFEEDAYNHSELRLTSSYIPNNRFRAVLSAEADYFMYQNESDWDYDDDVWLHEAYIGLSGKNVKLTAGNQIVKWGKADEISPLDNINPEDLRDGPIREREERKLAVPILNLECYQGMSKLQGLFIPFFYESELDFTGRNWAFFDHYDKEYGPFGIREKDYANTLRNAGAGFRFSSTVGKFDYALSYLHHRSNLPYVESLQSFGPLPAPSALSDLVIFARATNQPIELVYDHQSITGFEFETTWGDLGLRGDLAYIHEQSFTTADLKRVEKPVFSYVLGADYNGPHSLYVNFQFSQEIVDDYDDDIALAEEVTSAINGEITKGIFSDYVELGFRYYYNISNEDYYWSPAVRVEYWQNLTLEFGAEIVGGPDDTILGVYDDNDQYYGIVQIDF